ncbi:MAG: hypothetical protein AAF487_14805 [Bacteroidota bacterium]
MIELDFDKTDAQGFREIIETIIFNLIRNFNPDELSIIRIKNWFDHKWLNYSGKKIVPYDLETYPAIPYVLEPYWNKEITVPPFNPKRVLAEGIYRRKQVGSIEPEESLHKFQPTTENRNNLISRKLNDGLCIWVSSNSKSNKQGSLMVYQIKDSEISTWYLSIEEKDKWRVTKVKGIGMPQAYLLSTDSKNNIKN